MKALCSFNKNLWRFFLLVLVAAVTACSDNIDDSDIYTFKGETITSYLEKSENFTDFAYILTRVKLSKRSESTVSQLLSARGNYTVFAPTNDAVQFYLDSIFQTKNYDMTQIPDSLAEFIARNAIIDCGDAAAYETTDFYIGTLERTNMDDRYITIDFDTLSGGRLATIINNSALIVLPDVEVYNGFIHGVDEVLSLSRATVPALIEEADNLKIFNEILKRTGWDDSMKLYRDEEYEENHEDLGPDLEGNLVLQNPAHRYYGYTAFVETDSIFHEKWGIPEPVIRNGIVQNTDEIMARITERCQQAYPLATDPELTSPNNAVNQFVAYHLLPMRLTWDKLVVHYIEMGYAWNNPNTLSINVFQYYETMGPYRRLMKLTEGAQTDGKRINRHATYDTDTFDEIVCDRPGINIMNSNGTNISNALNGFYYPIDDILVYDDGVPGLVLNERLRWDVTEILPEMSTNGFRRQADNTHRPFPHGYFDNLVYSEESRCIYLPYYNTASQSNWQADEFNIRGQYDLTLLLPPVPNEGTYELRFCAPSNTGFGMAQFYFGSDKNNLQPVGLPVDLRIPPSNPNIGWEQDTEDEEHNNTNDKNMRNHGYMKPPMHNGIARSGAPVIESMRNTTTYAANLRMRKIIYTGNIYPQQKYYVRIKSLLTNPQACFLLDYIEWVPKHIYNGPTPEDKW